MRGVLKAQDQRARNDAYFTPDALARAVCARLAWLTRRDQARVLEPGAGAGAFIRAAQACWPRAAVVGLDLEPQAFGVERGDFLKLAPDAEFSLVVGNPPFLLAEQFVHAALKHVESGGHVALLLRLSFLGGQGRATSLWAKRDLRWLIPLTPRPSFTADGKTDASEYAVYVWQRGWLGNAEIDRPLWWRDSTDGPRAKQQGLGFTSEAAARSAPESSVIERRAEPEEAA